MNNLPVNKKGLIQVGGPISEITASLRISGDDLDPDEITALLRRAPTLSYRKGDIRVGKMIGQKYLRRTGMWLLEAIPETGQEDINDKITDLLDQVSDETGVWRTIRSRFSAEMFCGLFMNRSNEGLIVSASTIASLSNRGIELGFDIYGPEFNEDLDGHFEAARRKRERQLN